MLTENDHYQFINYYSDTGGIHDSNVSIDYDDISLRNKLDTISMGFKDHQKKKQP
jgi:hypothetical protein